MLLQIPTAVQDTVNQIATTATNVAPQMTQPIADTSSENYFTLLLKGGWILLPLFLLLAIAIYVIIERIVVLNTLGKSDSVWFSRIKDLVYEYKFESAEKFCLSSSNAYSKVIAAGQ